MRGQHAGGKGGKEKGHENPEAFAKSLQEARDSELQEEEDDAKEGS